MRKLSLYILLVLVNVFLALMNWNILGYDSFSFLSIIIVALLSINYLKKGNVKILLLLSISIGLSIAFRFPNVVLIPILLLIISYQRFRLKKINFLKHVLISTLTICFVFWFLALLSYGSLAVFKEAFIKALDDTNEQHGLPKLINTYIFHLGKILRNTSIIIVFYMLYLFLRLKKYSIWLYVFPVLIMFYLFYKHVYGSGYNDRAALFMASVVFSIILIQFFYSFKKEKGYKVILQERCRCLNLRSSLRSRIKNSFPLLSDCSKRSQFLYSLLVMWNKEVACLIRSS